MKKTILLFFIILLTLFSVVHSQPNVKTDSVPAFVKAKYLEGNLGKALLKNAIIRRESRILASGDLKSDPIGDVVISFVITKEGKLENMLMLSPVIEGLSTNGVNAVKQLSNQWAPTIEEGKAVDRRYTIVLRYRAAKTPEEYKATDYQVLAKAYEVNKKYDKALKSYNDAIKDNPFEYRLFESRAKVKALLGDIAGSNQDHTTSLELYADVMIVLNLYTSYPAPMQN